MNGFTLGVLFLPLSLLKFEMPSQSRMLVYSVECLIVSQPVRVEAPLVRNALSLFASPGVATDS